MRVTTPGQAGGFISREDAVAFLRQIQDAINAHDVAAIMDLYADDATLVSLFSVRSADAHRSPTPGM